jgi:chemotaxis regulatin CheY-phosphate phosphatase CheZ
MHVSVKRAINEIDACLFSSDPHEAELQELEKYFNRWLRRVATLREMYDEAEAINERAPRARNDGS